MKLMDDNQNITSDSATIARIFNDHFSALGAKVQQKIPVVDGSYNSYLYKKSMRGEQIINPNGVTFFLSPTMETDI